MNEYKKKRIKAIQGGKNKNKNKKEQGKIRKKKS